MNLLRSEKLLFFGLLIMENQVLSDEAQGSNRTWGYLLLVVGCASALLDAGVNQDLQVLLPDHGVDNLVGITVQSNALTVDDRLDLAQAADEREGPRVSDLDVWMGILHNLWRETFANDGVADVFIVCEDWASFLVLDQIPISFYDSRFQNLWHWNVALRVVILEIENFSKLVQKFNSIFFWGKYIQILLLIHETNDVENGNGCIYFNIENHFLNTIRIGIRHFHNIQFEKILLKNVQ